MLIFYNEIEIYIKYFKNFIIKLINAIIFLKKSLIKDLREIE
jgi:hypothetical protein